MSSQISKMSDMLADKKNKKTASASDLAGFDATVTGLESWAEFERVMGSSKSTMKQCKQAANDLATEWINSNEEAVLTKPEWQSIKDLGIALNNINYPTYKPYIPSFEPRNVQPTVYNIDSSVTVEGVATDKIVKDMENVATKSVEKAFAQVNNIGYTSKNISRR